MCPGLLSPMKIISPYLLAASLIILHGVHGPRTHAQARADDAPHVILISIDGLVPGYYLEPDRYGAKIPNLREFVSGGSSSTGAEGVFPTVTYPNHVAAITGVLPSDNGIVANGPFDPFDRTNGGWYWYTGDIKVPTLWDVARRGGKTAGSVYWPASIGAGVDYNFPEYRTVRTEDDVKLLRALATPGLIAGIEKEYGPIPGVRIVDRTRAQAAAYIIERHRPNLLLIHLTDLDGAQHRSGPGSREALEVLEQIDQNLGIIRAATQRAGLASRVTWIIMSDHGFRPVKYDFNPRVALRALGYLNFDAEEKLADWRVEASVSGGTFALIAKDKGDVEAIREATSFFESLAKDKRFGLAKLYSPAELQKLGAFPEAFLVGEAGDDFKIGSASKGPLVTTTTTKGMHGYHPARPDQLASLIFFGRGVVAQKRFQGGRLIDVAPTAAHLLGVPMPSARGEVLKSVLQTAP